jgi:hypothetical protein
LLAFMQMSLKSVSSNFMGEHKSVWHLKAIILKNIKRYIHEFDIFCKSFV